MSKSILPLDYIHKYTSINLIDDVDWYERPPFNGSQLDEYKDSLYLHYPTYISNGKSNSYSALAYPDGRVSLSIREPEADDIHWIHFGPDTFSFYSFSCMIRDLAQILFKNKFQIAATKSRLAGEIEADNDHDISYGLTILKDTLFKMNVNHNKLTTREKIEKKRLEDAIEYLKECLVTPVEPKPIREPLNKTLDQMTYDNTTPGLKYKCVLSHIHGWHDDQEAIMLRVEEGSVFWKYTDDEPLESCWEVIAAYEVKDNV